MTEFVWSEMLSRIGYWNALKLQAPKRMHLLHFWKLIDIAQIIFWALIKTFPKKILPTLDRS